MFEKIKRTQAFLFTAATAALLGTATLPSYAAGESASSVTADKDAKAARAGFEKITKAKVGAASPSLIPGLYELVIDGQIVYADKTGRFMLQGNIIDLEQKKNVTESRLALLNKVDLKTLPLSEAIKVVRGNGSRTMVTFEDPNCGFCKRLAPELAKLTNVTIFTLPVGILGQDSQIKAQAIVCSKEPAKLWSEAMAGQLASYSVSAGCKAADSIDRNTKLMSSMGLRGTPAMLFTDGSRLPGFVAADAIEAKLRTATN